MLDGVCRILDGVRRILDSVCRILDGVCRIFACLGRQAGRQAERGREGGREGRGGRQAGRQAGREGEGGEGLHHCSCHRRSAACSAPQPPAPSSRHAALSRSRTMSFGPSRPWPRARSNSAAWRSEGSRTLALDRVYMRERELMGAHAHTGASGLACGRVNTVRTMMDEFYG